MRNKGLVLELDSKSDLEIVKQSDLAKIGLKAESPRKLGPSIIIYDIDKEVSKEAILEQLLSKNLDDVHLDRDVLKDQIIFRFPIKTKNNEKLNWVIEVPVLIYKNLLRKERVFIGFMSHRIKEFINITRCFKCFAYGHIAKNCTEPEQLCETCGETGHVKNDCPKKDKKPVCVNCKRAKRKEHEHNVRDLKCPSYKRQLELYYKKIQWE
jgi:Arginine methyltransferase-interacting protein, contains RING Zn-finger